MNKKSKFNRAIHWAENLIITRAIRNGLVNLIPILIIGAFALILKTLPIPGYVGFLENFAGGMLLSIFDFVFTATFGVLSVYMTISISRAYMSLKADLKATDIGAVIASLVCFFMLAGVYLPDFKYDFIGPKSMFLALITGLGASSMYLSFHRFFRKRTKHLYSAGADKEFNHTLGTILPITCVVLIFAGINTIIMYVFEVDSFRMFLAMIFNNLFSLGETGFIKGFFFVLLSSILWFFGIHGSDTLENVMETYFTPGIQENIAMVAGGNEPTNILTKQFFDCFVLMGGCGATICLLITILIFSRNHARRSLGIAAAFPMIFNINELMVFGLPIIFNPIMLIPFITVPLVSYSVAYIATVSGLVPMITSDIVWTTPIFIGGYQATGSIAGSILQLVNVVIGVLIYLPFVKMLDKESEENSRSEYNYFMEYFKNNEQGLINVRLTEQKNMYGEFAKGLCSEIRHGMKKNMVIAYQPQYNYDGSCIGVEALLRWKHPLHGIIYPPLVVKMAEEGGFLAELEETVLDIALKDRDAILVSFGENIKMSINVTGTTIVTPRFAEYCKFIDSQSPFKGKNICFEVTEQTAITFNEETIDILKTFRKIGIILAIDDFSMGQTSLNYLKNNLFDIIKLDGSLINGLFDFNNSREIISSITQLADNLNLTVLSEYVETEEQRAVLHEIGCDNYQGYLFSPAVYLNEEGD